jgi:hypothetical protein
MKWKGGNPPVLPVEVVREILVVKRARDSLREQIKALPSPQQIAERHRCSVWAVYHTLSGRVPKRYLKLLDP